MPLLKGRFGYDAPDSRRRMMPDLPGRGCPRWPARHSLWRRDVEAFERLKQLVTAAEEDVRKAEGGNKAAGTRARQMMQQIKDAAQAVRQAILQIRQEQSGKTGSASSPPPS